MSIIRGIKLLETKEFTSLGIGEKFIYLKELILELKTAHIEYDEWFLKYNYIINQIQIFNCDEKLQVIDNYYQNNFVGYYQEQVSKFSKSIYTLGCYPSLFEDEDNDDFDLETLYKDCDNWIFPEKI